MGLSRNKVAVPEGAAGTPPFWIGLLFVSILFVRYTFLREGYGVSLLVPASLFTYMEMKEAVVVAWRLLPNSVL